MRFNLDKESMESLPAEGLSSKNKFYVWGQNPSSHSRQLSLSSGYFLFLVTYFWDSRFISFHYLW